MPQLRLEGCTPEPLMAYLKALGVLRLVSEHAQSGDPGARAGWRGGVFVLQTKLRAETLLRFFLDSYRPTPLVSPWAGGSGFFGSDNRTAVEAIAQSRADRMADFAAIIRQVRELLAELGIRNKPSQQVKENLLRRYRRDLPDSFVAWIDTALVLQASGWEPAPLLGTGGNDGRMDFTQNYMQRLTALGFPAGVLVPEAETWLRQSLYGEATPHLLLAAVGQFDPGRAGGPNASTGMAGEALVNPWDYVFMLEGCLVLAGAAVRRLGIPQRDKAAFPFTVRHSPVGYGSGSDHDEPDSRGEIWLPLWSRMTSLAELQFVFAEGRAEYNGRQARYGIDFARAVATLGVDRGLDGFVRYGFLKRSGKAFVAAPLGTFPVRARRDADLLRELDPLLEALRKACTGEEVPARFCTARRHMERALFDFCKYGEAVGLTEVVAALGMVERELALGDTPPEKRRIPHPVAGLSAEWIRACDDGSAEFHLARSLAFLGGQTEKTKAFRMYLEPVTRSSENDRWTWTKGSAQVVWGGGDLPTNLAAILARRLMGAESSDEAPLPLASIFPSSLGHLSAFLLGRTDDRKLADLLWGLMLISSPGKEKEQDRPKHDLLLPSAYALLKLTLLPGCLQWQQQDREAVLRLKPNPPGEERKGIAVKTEPAMLAKLAGGDVQAACEIAARRLRASGLTPLASHRSDGSLRKIAWSAPGVTATRLLAALLFPISNQAVNDLAKLVLRRPSAAALLQGESL